MDPESPSMDHQMPKRILLYVDWDDLFQPASPPSLLGLPRLRIRESDTAAIPGPATISFVRGGAGAEFGGTHGPAGEFAIAFGSGVSAALLAAWIWEALEKSPRPAQVKVDGLEAAFEEEALTRLIIQRIEHELAR